MVVISTPFGGPGGQDDVSLGFDSLRRPPVYAGTHRGVKGSFMPMVSSVGSGVSGIVFYVAVGSNPGFSGPGAEVRNS